MSPWFKTMALTDNDKQKIREAAIRNLEIQAYQAELDEEINPSLSAGDRARLRAKLDGLRQAITILEKKNNGGPL